MKIRAIFIDIDGTLLNSRMVIEEDTRKSLMDFQKSGGKIILSSARPYIGMKKFGYELELAKYGGYYSAFNGGQIIDATTLETIHSQHFTLDDIRQIFDFIQQVEKQSQEQGLNSLKDLQVSSNRLTRAYALAIHSAIDKTSLNIMTYKEDTLIMMRQEMYAVAEALVNSMAMSVQSDFMKAIDFTPVKILISGDPSLIHGVYPIMSEKLHECYDVVTSDPFFIEITPKDINKGKSVEVILKNLNIPLHEAAAFGDSLNDISMLEKAGIGIAMGNAVEELKQIADFITISNDENGIAYALREYLFAI